MFSLTKLYEILVVASFMIYKGCRNGGGGGGGGGQSTFSTSCLGDFLKFFVR